MSIENRSSTLIEERCCLGHPVNAALRAESDQALGHAFDEPVDTTGRPDPQIAEILIPARIVLFMAV
jgi:hypothetical protein